MKQILQSLTSKVYEHRCLVGGILTFICLSEAQVLNKLRTQWTKMHSEPDGDLHARSILIELLFLNKKRTKKKHFTNEMK